MDGYAYIKQRQVLWARRRGLSLVGSAGDRGEHAYTTTLDANLFQPLSDKARACYEQGDGNELGNGVRPGKLQAVHSSAALAANVFDYWMIRAEADPLLQTLGLPAARLGGIELERKFPISPRHRRAPNLDVVVRYAGDSGLTTVAIECKFTEAYSSRGHGGLKPDYLEDKALWAGLPSLRTYAASISPADRITRHLHPAQLIKHVLGLRATGAPDSHRLLYLWYDVPTEDGDRHREELRQFTAIARADGVDFHSMTWQALILQLAGCCESGHRRYVDYLADRYL